MKSVCLSFLSLTLSYYGFAQNAIGKFQADNVRIMERHKCEMALIEEEKAAIFSKNYDPVIRKAGECISGDNASAITYEIRGKAYVEKGDLNAALTDYNTAVVMAKAGVDSAKKLEEELGAIVSNGTKSAKEELSMVYAGRAGAYIYRGERANAETDLKAALALNPDSYELKSTLRDLDAKIAERSKEGRIKNPRSAADYVLAGDEYSRGAKDDAALAAYNKAISLDVDYMPAYLGKADAYFHMDGKMESAIQNYNIVLLKQPGNVKALTGRGYAHIRQKEWAAAVNDFSAAIKANKPDMKLLNGRGAAQLGKGNYADALKDFDKSAAMATGSDMYDRITALTGQGDAYRIMGKNNDALSSYNKAIDAAKSDVFAQFALTETYLGRGRLYATTGRKDLARADFNAILKIVPKHKDAAAELAGL